MLAVMSDPDCLFCSIVSGDVPADVVVDGDLALAFRDINPQAPTHVLVIPKLHAPNAIALAATSPESLVSLFTTAEEVAEADGLSDHRTVFNTGAGAQQTVFHAHLHVLGGREFTWPPG